MRRVALAEGELDPGRQPPSGHHRPQRPPVGVERTPPDDHVGEERDRDDEQHRPVAVVVGELVDPESELTAEAASGRGVHPSGVRPPAVDERVPRAEDPVVDRRRQEPDGRHDRDGQPHRAGPHLFVPSRPHHPRQHGHGREARRQQRLDRQPDRQPGHEHGTDPASLRTPRPIPRADGECRRQEPDRHVARIEHPRVVAVRQRQVGRRHHRHGDPDDTRPTGALGGDRGRGGDDDRRDHREDRDHEPEARPPADAGGQLVDHRLERALVVDPVLVVRAAESDRAFDEHPHVLRVVVGGAQLHVEHGDERQCGEHPDDDRPEPPDERRHCGLWPVLHRPHRSSSSTPGSAASRTTRSSSRCRWRSRPRSPPTAARVDRPGAG